MRKFTFRGVSMGNELPVSQSSYIFLHSFAKTFLLQILLPVFFFLDVLTSSAQNLGITTTGTTSYPQTTIGNTLTEASGNAGNNLIFNQVITSVPLTAIAIKTYGSVSSTNGIKVSIYNDNAGNPGTKLFTEVTATVTANTPSTITIPSTYLPAGTYWLASNMNSTSSTANFITKSTGVAGSVRKFLSGLTFATTFPNNPSVATLAAGTQDHIAFIGIPIQGYAKATKAVLGVTGTFSSVNFYSHAAGNVRLAIYNDAGGAPSAKQWESGDVAVSANMVNTVNINSGTPTSLVLSSGTYWLAWQWNSAANGPSYAAGAAGTGNYIVQTYGAFPASWSGGTASTENWTEYASYTCTIPAPTLPAAACQGTTITITGSNFAAGTGNTVTFTGAPGVSSLAGTTATSLQVTIPNTATTGPITISNGSCSVITGSYTVNPKPTVTSLPDPACVGTTITIPGTNFAAATGNTVTFTGAGGVSSEATTTATSLQVIIPVGATTGTITISNGSCSVVTGSYTIGPPTATPPASGCIGSLLTIPGTNFTAGTGNTVTFTGAAGVVSDVTTTATSLKVIIPAAATTGPITITNSYGCSVVTGSFTVNVPPTATLPAAACRNTTITITGSNFAINTGNQVTFTGASAVSSLAGTTASSLQVAIPNTATTGPITISNGTCSVTTASYMVNIPPTATPPASGCQNATITISGTNFATGTGNQVTFTGASPVASLVATTATSLQVIVPNTASTGPIIINNGTCSVTTASFTVNVPPTATLPAAACQSTTITITGTGFATNAGNTVTFTGASGVASLAGTTATSLQVTIPANATTGPITINNGTCSFTTGSYTVNPLPAFPGNPSSNSPQCADLGVTLTRAGSPPAGVAFYWQGITAAGTSTTNSNTTYNTKTDLPNGVSGTYYIRARTDLPAGCWSATSGSLAVVINALPSSVSVTPGTTDICSNNPVTLAGSASISSLATSTIVADGFNNAFAIFTPTGTGAFYNTNSAATDGAASSPFFVEGTHSAGITNGTRTLTSTSDINTTGYSNVKLSLRLAAFSLNSQGNGMETTDNIIVAISTNSGGAYTNIATITGGASGNTWWPYSAALTATTAYPTVATFAPGTGTGDHTADGYGTLNITSLPSISTLRVRISMTNNSTNERWVIDDFKITGDAPAVPQYAWSANQTSPSPSGLSAAQQSFLAANSNINVSPTTGLTATPIIYTVTAKDPVTGCTASASTSTVTVDPVPSVSSPQTVPAICSGDNFSFTPTGTPAGTTYTWTAATGTNISGGTANAVPGVESAISQTLTISGSVAHVATFTATPKTGSCTGLPFTVNVTVNPAPVVADKNTSTCSGVAFTVTPGDAPGGTTYIWGDPDISPNPGDITGVGSEFSPQTSISQTPVNSGTQIQTVTYTVFPVTGSCSGNPFTVTVTVNPTPVLTSPLGNGSQCSGNFSYTPTSAVENGATFSWTRAAVPGISQPAAGPTAGGVNETLTNTGNAPVLVTYAYTLTANGCNNVQNVTVTINPDNKISSATSGVPAVCPSGSTLLTANGVTNFNSSVDWYTAPGGGGTHVGGPYAGSGSVAGPTVGPGTYYARVTGNCGAAAEQSVVVGTTTYTITASAGAGGTISDPGVTVVNCESTPSYTITPNGGFAIQDVLVDGVSVGAVGVYNFTSVTANHTIAASFVNLAGADYRSFTSGGFSNPANWEYYNGITWVNPAPVPPGIGNNVNIRNTHNMVLDMNFTVGSGKTLLMDATSSLVVNPNRTLTVTGTATLNGQSVVFKSDATGTASLGNSSGSFSGETNVTVERYFPVAGVATGRSWRLLTIPVTSATKTIRDAWAGHAANPNAPAGEVAGSGTQITGVGYGDGATAAAAGYDWWTAIANTASSIRNYTISGANGGWTQTPSTGTLLNAAEQGYMLFVRGDRTVTTGSGATTLRPNGTIKTGTQSYSIPAPGTAAYKVIGNPYAATISFESLMTNGVNSTRARDNRFWQWDANMGTNGGYRLVNKLGAGNWIRVPALFSDPSPSHSEYIFSSQAFIIETLSAGTNDFTITENDKPTILSGTPPSVFDAGTAGRFYANLNMDNGGSLLLTDGVLASFDGGGNNGIDGNDVGKIDNFNENISLVRNSKRLTLEARNLISSNAGNKDTLYFQMSNLTPRNYAFQFKGVQMQNGLTAKLQDLYLGKETSISTTGDITTVNFSVTADASSGAADRFRVVFKADPSLPLTLTSAKAYSLNNGVQVDWKTVNEKGVKNYEVEKSQDGRSFSKATSVTAQNGAANSYGWYDAAPVKGNNYYRIKSIGTSGETSFSQVLVVNFSGGRSAFTIYPNPVKGNRITLQLSNMEKGKYAMTVYNAAGQRVMSKDITHLGGSATEEIDFGSALASGVYRVSFSTHNGTTLNQTLVVQR